jgi:hypothetical protein
MTAILVLLAVIAFLLLAIYGAITGEIRRREAMKQYRATRRIE